uniref:CCHC-type domain-containing protein n=1 Tax=Chenopodium quinoa TaxID=63459 RepID=A0A803LVM3_CHEQI
MENQGNYHGPIKRGVLGRRPSSHKLRPPTNWDSSVIGRFQGLEPPSRSTVHNIVDTRWIKRAPIRVKRIGNFYAFVCSNSRDVDALLKLDTTVTGLPLDHLDPEWAVEALCHVGYIVKVEDYGEEEPFNPDYRALVIVDFSKTLLPGCFLPTDIPGQAIWVYFQYEGVFKYCKICGSLGHYTTTCVFTEYEATRRLKLRYESFMQRGYDVIFGPPGHPLFTNLIEGLPDWYVHRNTKVNLLLLGDGAAQSFHGYGGNDDPDNNNGDAPDDDFYHEFDPNIPGFGYHHNATE